MIISHLYVSLVNQGIPSKCFNISYKIIQLIFEEPDLIKINNKSINICKICEILIEKYQNVKHCQICNVCSLGNYYLNLNLLINKVIC